MSGRIRSIKPEILDDATTAGLSDAAFRLFVASIVLADDYGRLRAEPSWLRGQVYWSRDISESQFAKALEELIPLLLFYSVKGQRYAEIRNWSKHQMVHKPGKPRIPSPSEVDGESPGTPAESPEKFRESLETLPTDLRSGPPIRTTDHLTTSGDVESVWGHYVETCAKVRPRKRPRLSPADRKAIAAALKTWTVEDLTAAISGLFMSSHHLGQNDRDTEYLDIVYALRKPGMFISIHDDRKPPTPIAKPVPVEQSSVFVDGKALDDLFESFGKRSA